MFITPAFADTAATVATAAANGAPEPNLVTSLMPVFMILVVFYLLVLRPQNKRLQAHRDMVGGLAKGDKVVTGGGLIGTVKKIVNDDEVTLEIADGVQVNVVRSTIMAVREKAA